jgi:hypothetical protein
LSNESLALVTESVNYDWLASIMVVSMDLAVNFTNGAHTHTHAPFKKFANLLCKALRTGKKVFKNDT